MGEVRTPFPVFINEIIDDQKEYLNHFNYQWNTSQNNLKNKILGFLNTFTEDLSPALLYKSILKEIFNFSQVDERLDSKLNKIGFKESAVWNLRNLKFYF